MISNELREKFAKAYPDDAARFARHRDLEIKAIKAMIFTSEKEEKEYDRILNVLIEEDTKNVRI